MKLEASEIIELKQLVMDRDEAAAAAFFRRVVAPRTLEAARRLGILDDGEEQEVRRGRISG